MWRMQACGKISIASSVKINPARKIGEMIRFISGSTVLALNVVKGVVTSRSTSGRFLEAS